MTSLNAISHTEKTFLIKHEGITLHADIRRPPEEQAKGVILFAHGSGSSRMSPRNQAVAFRLVTDGFATVLLDLLTEEEDRRDQVTREYRFDIPLLAERLEWATEWLSQQPEFGEIPMGYFGASTGAAAALIAAARHQETVAAIVSRGGRPDLAQAYLGQVQAPTLLIVGGNDPEVLELNRAAAEGMTGTVKIEIVAGATHLFEEPGALEQVTEFACEWFAKYLL